MTKLEVLAVASDALERVLAKRESESRTDTARSVENMIAIWILTAGIVGGIGGVGSIAWAIGGLIVCSAPSNVGGLIGGEEVGTVIGTSSVDFGAISVVLIGLDFGINFGGLLGSTIRPWIRITYRHVLGL
jgi:hypothetical protein